MKFSELEIGDAFQVFYGGNPAELEIGIKVDRAVAFFLSGPGQMSSLEVDDRLAVVKVGRVGTFAPNIARGF